MIGEYGNGPYGPGFTLKSPKTENDAGCEVRLHGGDEDLSIDLHNVRVDQPSVGNADMVQCEGW